MVLACKPHPAASMITVSSTLTLNIAIRSDLKRYPRGAGDGVANPVRHKRYPRGAGDGVANPVRHKHLLHVIPMRLSVAIYVYAKR
jgi:hypothetical protein